MDIDPFSLWTMPVSLQFPVSLNGQMWTELLLTFIANGMHGILLCCPFSFYFDHLKDIDNFALNSFIVYLLHKSKIKQLSKWSSLKMSYHFVVLQNLKHIG